MAENRDPATSRSERLSYVTALLLLRCRKFLNKNNSALLRRSGGLFRCAAPHCLVTVITTCPYHVNARCEMKELDKTPEQEN